MPRHLKVLHALHDGGTINPTQMRGSNRTLEVADTKVIKRDSGNQAVPLVILPILVFESILTHPPVRVGDVPVHLTGIEGVRLADLDRVQIRLRQLPEEIRVVEEVVDDVGEAQYVDAVDHDVGDVCDTRSYGFNGGGVRNLLLLAVRRPHPRGELGGLCFAVGLPPAFPISSGVTLIIPIFSQEHSRNIIVTAAAIRRCGACVDEGVVRQCRDSDAQELPESPRRGFHRSKGHMPSTSSSAGRGALVIEKLSPYKLELVWRRVFILRDTSAPTFESRRVQNRPNSGDTM